MYVSMKDILDKAAAGNYAVIACSPINMEMARAMVAAATDKNAPIIFLLGQNMMRLHAKAELMIPLIKTLAEYTPVPIATCLDHGNDPERISYAFRNGFSSIMIDGSQYPMEKNIEETRKVIELCRRHGLAVEAEIGHVGIAANHDGQDSSQYTSVEDARYFVQQVEPDCLAIAVGTAHGEYPKGVVPHINYERIRAVKEATGNIPLALHGGSGSGDGAIVKSVEAGINKINVVTDIMLEARAYLANTLSTNPKIAFIDLMAGMEQAVRSITSHWIDLSGSAGRAQGFTMPNRFYTLTSKSAQGKTE